MRGAVRAACQVSLLVMAFGPSGAWADAAGDQPQAGEAAVPAGALQEVVVTATRREESLSKVPISVTALTQESLDNRGIKDFSEVARFTPGVTVDKCGTITIARRGMSGRGGAGTTGIYLDDTPIQMRALAFSPDEAVPKSFDIDRVEVLRGPQGTLFGSGSEGGTVRYITTQPSLSKTSVYARTELATTQGGDLSYEAGAAVGGPLVEGKFGARLSVWYRRDGGWIDRIDPYTLATVDRNGNRDDNVLLRLAGLWAVSDKWAITPSIYYQARTRHDISTYWPLYSNPGSDRFVSADPDARNSPDRFYLPAIKVEGDLGAVRLISNTSFYHRENRTGYEGTLYNLGYYQTQNAAPIFCNPAFSAVCAGGTPWLVPYPLLDGSGLHVPGLNYHSPSTIDNGQENLTQEIRLQSTDPTARLLWTAGVFANENRQTYFEQINDPMLGQLTNAVFGDPTFTDFFCYLNAAGQCTGPAGYVPGFGTDSYFLKTNSKDTQVAVFGELTYAFTDRLKTTVGARYSRMKYNFDTLTGGPQLYAPTRSGTGDISENAFTPKATLQFQMDQNNLFYAAYAKGFRPGGANNPIPFAACPTDFANFGVVVDPSELASHPGSRVVDKFSSDTVQSFEVGAKNNFDNRVRLASSVYYIKWNNIQQLVVPPVCQISFIANTGQAVAKGADIQADVSLGGGLSLELAAGYTSARYTQDFRFSSVGLNQNPLVANGDSIEGASSETGGGQGTAPYSAALGVEYRFSAFSHESFVRLDGEYQARAKWTTAGQDPGTSQFDSANFVLPGTTFVSARGGAQFGAWSLAAFVDNLTNTHALTDYNTTINPLVAGVTRLQRDFTFRPRTIGVTAIFRQ
ncbi:MAG: TonB-dependent receptor [Steroidobacteraceae bacterium]